MLEKCRFLLDKYYLVVKELGFISVDEEIVFLLKNKYNLRCKRNIIFCWRNITLVDEKLMRKVPPVLGGVKYYYSVWGNTISVVGGMLKKSCIGRKVQL